MSNNPNVVSYRDENGRDLKLDLTDGRLFDQSGNQVAKWSVTDQRDTAALSRYAEDFSFRQSAYAMSLTDKDRARQMLLSHDGGERAVTMDLGVGDVHIPSAMPNFASGYSNEPPIADLASPVILANKSTDKYFQYPKEDAFQRATPLVGAPATGVPEIAPRPSSSQYTTLEYSLGGYVSTELQANQDAPLNVKLATMDRIMNAHLIDREIRVATLLTTSSNWDSGAVATVTATTGKWNGGASSDPVADIHGRIDASYGKPTAIIMSGKLFRAFQRNPAVRAYFAYKDGSPAVPDASQMQAVLSLPKIIVGEMQYIDTSGVKQFVWGNNAVLIRQPRQMPPTDQRDVATSYTFRWNLGAGDLGPGGNEQRSVKGGWIVREFFTQDRGGLGGIKLVVVYYDAEKMTSIYAGGLLVNAYQ